MKDPYLFELFSLMQQEHDIILNETELHDIVQIVQNTAEPNFKAFANDILSYNTGPTPILLVAIKHGLMEVIEDTGELKGHVRKTYT